MYDIIIFEKWLFIRQYLSVVIYSFFNTSLESRTFGKTLHKNSEINKMKFSGALFHA